MKKEIFAEVGFGNDTFFSTEIEEGDSEYRVPRFVKPPKITGIYLRLWIFKTVFILSTRSGFKIKKKERNKFKILFGIAGKER